MAYLSTLDDLPFQEIRGLTIALIGVIFLMLGTSAAILAVPTTIAGPESLIPASAIFSIGLLAPTVFSWRRDLSSLLRGENILLGALFYWVMFEMLQGAFVIQSSHDIVAQEFLLLGLTAMGFWIGATVGRPLHPKILVQEATARWSDQAVFWLALLTFALGIWDFFYRADFNLESMIDALFLPRFDAPWQREALGDWSAFSAHLQFFGYLVPPLAVLCWLRFGAWHSRTIVVVFLAIVTVVFNAQGGGRRVVGALILAALFSWLIQRRYLNWRRLLAFLVAIGGLLAVMQLMLIYRNIGFGDSASVIDKYEYLHVDGNFVALGQLLEFIPDVSPHVGWEFIIYALVRPIPRVFWPGKPVDGGFDLAEAMGVPHTSFAITIAGELYLSFGFLGAFVGGWVYGRLATLANVLLSIRTREVNPVFPSLVLVWLFVGVRSMLEIMIFGYVLLAILLVGRFARFVASLRRETSDAR